MITFKVGVIRIAYGHREFVVEAESAEQAENIADEMAGDYEFNMRSTEYNIDYISEVEDGSL
ncbi:hypothetical protein [Methylotenera sp.]|uniref:hypothetical protein n=1 Tax=Methylotenera sp. TaxID=2051956 RepID=UPI0024874DD9|nr:hypothetical protein [Methylotenera sp.]MDI1362578.1 hypothetical protein [Methylotenera sp.]